MSNTESRIPIIFEGHPPIHPLNLELTPQQVEQGLKKWKVDDAEKLAQLYRLIYEGTLAGLAEPPLLQYIRWRFCCVSQTNLRLESETIKVERLGWLELEQSIYESILNNPELEAQLLEIEQNNLPIIIADVFIEPVESQLTYHTIVSLMNALENLQIGRPSTYGTIFRNLQDKGHIQITEQGDILLTERGKEVQQAIALYLPILADISFTMELEEAFEAIIQGKRTSLSILEEYWSRLDPRQRYPKALSSSQPRSSLGDKVEAQLSSEPQWIVPPNTHPLHKANKVLEQALQQCSFSFDERVYDENQLLPNLNKVIRVWFLGYLYGLDNNALALLDRLTFDYSFRWFAQIPISRRIWNVKLYLQTICYLQQNNVIQTVEKKLRMDDLIGLPIFKNNLRNQ